MKKLIIPLLLLVVVSIAIASEPPPPPMTTSQLWDVNDPDNRLRDFTNVGCMGGAVPIPNWPVGVNITDFGAFPNDGIVLNFVSNESPALGIIRGRMPLGMAAASRTVGFETCISRTTTFRKSHQPLLQKKICAAPWSLPSALNPLKACCNAPLWSCPIGLTHLGT